MARVDYTSHGAMALLLSHLRRQLDLNETTCFETLFPDAPPRLPAGGGLQVTVAPVGGIFDVELQIGGGAGQLMESETWTVTIYSRLNLDRAHHDEQLLRHAIKGLWPLKQKLLKAIIGVDLTINDDDDTFLRQLLYVTRSGAPKYDPDKHVGWLSVDVAIDFDWDLS